jgi:hypothetical protein
MINLRFGEFFNKCYLSQKKSFLILQDIDITVNKLQEYVCNTLWNNSFEQNRDVTKFVFRKPDNSQ